MVSGLGAEGADGSKIVINTPTVGRIANGAIVEREVASSFEFGDTITLNLRRADFSTAQNVVSAINDNFGRNVARALDAISIEVFAPRDQSERVNFLAAVENLEVDIADEAAKIIVNSRTGTIVIGKDVKLHPVAITHGGLTVTVKENIEVYQPNAFAEGESVQVPNSSLKVEEKDTRMFKLETSNSLDDLVRTINRIGLAPGDLMSVLEALEQAGAIEGELVII